MRLLLVDTETTGLLEDPTARVTEVGYIVYDSEHGLIRAKSVLVNPLKPSEELTPEIIEITGITTEMLREFGYSPREVFVKLADKLNSCHAIVAANCGFDRGMIEREVKLLPDILLQQRVWIDFLDLPFDKRVKGRSTHHIAADHGIINHFAHRALGDCFAMCAVIENYKGRWDWREIINLACEPRVTLEAAVTYAQKDKARAAGFKWDGVARRWLKTLPMSKADQFRLSCDFTVKTFEAKV